MRPESNAAGGGAPASVIQNHDHDHAIGALYNPDEGPTQLAASILASRFGLTPSRARLVAGLAIGGVA